MSNANVILTAYIIYASATVAAFRLRPPEQAALLTLFCGWLFLPVAVYPAAVTSGERIDDVIGTLLPGMLSGAKALVCPLTALAGLAVFAPGLFRRFRPSRLDYAMAAFCLSPLIAWVAGLISGGSACGQAAYLSGAWGAPWMVGRLALDNESGRHGLITAIIASGLVLIPIAVVESVGRFSFYSATYGPHPFQHDGLMRYFGFRPLGFFEHSNQYGIWIALAALAGVGRAANRRKAGDWVVAGLLVITALASQSVGAIILMVAGATWLAASVRVRRFGMGVALALTVIGGAGYLSGKLPLEHWAKETSAGRVVYDGLRASGRGSLIWRVKRDQVAAPSIQRAALTGYGKWDWWRPLKSRPWGLPLLIAGQFGFLSLLFATLAIFGGPVRELLVGRSNVLAVIVLAAGVDAWLNSYAFFPAILTAGALARPVWRAQPRQESNGSSRAAQAGQTLAIDPD